LKERVGDFDKFLTTMGVPAPIKFALTNLVSKAEEWTVTKEGETTSVMRTELAMTMFGSNTVARGVPLSPLLAPSLTPPIA